MKIADSLKEYIIRPVAVYKKSTSKEDFRMKHYNS